MTQVRNRRLVRATSTLVATAAPLALVLTAPPAVGPAASSAQPPNVVLIVVDDLSENLLPYMGELQDLAADGITFENFVVATPWCCPSRATIQSGQYPHNTGVLSNSYPLGGFESFLQGDMADAVGVQMQRLGYRTGFMGKYMNGYSANGQSNDDLPYFPPKFVPPGWDTWFSGGSGAQQFHYTVVESVDNSPPVKAEWNGHAESNYHTDVLSGRAQDFLHAGGNDPFFLMLTPFAPHRRSGDDPQGNYIQYPPAPRDRATSDDAPAEWAEPPDPHGDCGVTDCVNVPWPDSSSSGSVNRLTTNPLPWMPDEQLSAGKLAKGRDLHVQRIQMVQAVDDLISDVRQALESAGEADSTYLLFASDNGYHLGEHALFGGKTTAYDHDVKIPLVLSPPGGAGGRWTLDALVQNTDLLPTLLDIAGAPPDAAADGTSVLPLVEDFGLPWRAAALVELTNDDDADGARRPAGSRNPDTASYEGDDSAPTYNALRTQTYLYVDYSRMDELPPGTDEAEFYDLVQDPNQVHNRYAELSEPEQDSLNAELLDETGCAGAGCWAAQADVPSVDVPVLPVIRPPPVPHVVPWWPAAAE